MLALWLSSCVECAGCSMLADPHWLASSEGGREYLQLTTHGTARVIRDAQDYRSHHVARECCGSRSQLEGFSIHGGGILADRVIALQHVDPQRTAFGRDGIPGCRYCMAALAFGDTSVDRPK